MNPICLLALPLAVIVLAGCDSKTAENTAPESETVHLFKEGKGVWFSDETIKLFGLEVAEVQEKPVQRRFEKTAQVYRARLDDVPASAVLLLSTDEAKEVRVGQSVSLKASTPGAPEISGRLVRLDTQTQTVFGQIEALIEFTDPQQRFPAGTFVSATFTNDVAKGALVIPESALLTAADGRYVYTVNGTHLTRTRIKAGTTCDGFVEVEDGLYAGDSVAAQGVENLWLVELSALKGGTPCCPVPKKNADK